MSYDLIEARVALAASRHQALGALELGRRAARASSRIAAERKLGIGRAATPAEIAGWDIDVRPDGQGLPPGKGSVKDGEAVYMAQMRRLPRRVRRERRALADGRGRAGLAQASTIR